VYPLDFIKVLAVTFIALFPIVNPIGDAPIFLSLTGRYPRSAQKVLARKIAAYSFALLAASFLFGSEVLSFFGITLVVIQITGGLIVAGMGWRLLNQESATSFGGQESDTLEDALEHAFYPLTLPITIDPGCISVAITLGAHLRHEAGAGFVHGYPRHFLAALAGIFLVCVLIGLCYGSADRLLTKLGKTGTNILTRLSAFILMAIGIQIMWNGLSSGLPEMLAHTATR
jgi:multiple antibiotic resistance protein